MNDSSFYILVKLMTAPNDRQIAAFSLGKRINIKSKSLMGFFPEE